MSSHKWKGLIVLRQETVLKRQRDRPIRGCNLPQNQAFPGPYIWGPVLTGTLSPVSSSAEGTEACEHRGRTCHVPEPHPANCCLFKHNYFCKLCCWLINTLYFQSKCVCLCI